MEQVHVLLELGEGGGPVLADPAEDGVQLHVVLVVPVVPVLDIEVIHSRVVIVLLLLAVILFLGLDVRLEDGVLVLLVHQHQVGFESGVGQEDRWTFLAGHPGRHNSGPVSTVCHDGVRGHEDLGEAFEPALRADQLLPLVLCLRVLSGEDEAALAGEKLLLGHVPVVPGLFLDVDVLVHEHVGILLLLLLSLIELCRV